MPEDEAAPLAPPTTGQTSPRWLGATASGAGCPTRGRRRHATSIASACRCATISATEAPALFNVSPYVTRWMLYKKFADGVDIDGAEDARMSWGKKLQPLIVAQAAEELRLEVRSNAEDVYHRRGLLGCTRDAEIICPDRGRGALETKCVFDYGVWMRDWAGGKMVPRTHEIQLQQQMLVGDAEHGEVGEHGPQYDWGVIAPGSPASFTTSSASRSPTCGAGLNRKPRSSSSR
jgi:hypothetical protein